MDPSFDFKSVQDKIQNALVATTKTTNRIASQDLSFLRTLDPSVADRLDEKTGRLLRLSKGLLEAASKTTGQIAPNLEDVDDIDIAWRGTVDVIDSLLEKADTCLDEYTGLIKRKAAPSVDSGPASKKPKQTDRLDYSLRRANMLKPQNGFERKADNFPSGPWKPLLSTKPHASVALENSLGTFQDEEDNTQYDPTIYFSLILSHLAKASAIKDAKKRKTTLSNKRRMLQRLGTTRDTNGNFRYKHPYETEISNLKYPDSLYENRDPIPYLPVEKSAAIWVDTFEGVLDMLEDLKKAPEIAIDLEHHDFRTYNGLLSLMQVSTRDKDWVIDTLKPWRHRLEVLNEVFADPTKVKVFHGAYMDIIWLQRDLGLYIVGLFDTFHACEALSYPTRSLAYLLKKFADFDADKKYQLADWRIRPLPEEMLYYARSDTHYLLYVFDMLRNEILEHTDRTNPDKDLMGWVLQRSKETSLQRYSNFESDAETGRGARGWLASLSKTSVALNGQQFAVYKAVHQWRDDLARQEDESPGFYMAPHAVMEIAKIMPTDIKALHSCLGNSAPAVKTSINDLFKVVQDAIAEGANAPSLMDFYRQDSMGQVAKRELGDARTSSQEPQAQDTYVPPVEELRLEQSQLLGPVPISSLWEQRTARWALPTRDRIPVPWTSLVENASVLDGEGLPPAKEVDAATTDAPTGRPAEDEVSADPFTLRRGTKRKSDTIQQESAQESDTSSEEEDTSSEEEEEEEEEEAEQSKEARKEERKKAKRLAQEEEEKRRLQRKAEKKKAKEARTAQESGADEEGDFVPFDYNSAQSVLHSQRASNNVASDDKKRKKKKAFDPYTAKIADGPKGARRMHGEKAGKSATFKK